MNKILICVYVPSLAKEFEIFISEKQKMYEAIPLISKAIEKYSDGEYHTSGKEILCTREVGNVIDINFSACELGIHNGASLILI